MTRWVAIAMLALGFVGTAAAQMPGGRGGWGGPGGGGPRQWINQMLEGFDGELSFSEQQWAQMDPIIDAQVERAQAAFARWGEVGQAMADGDQQRAQELRRQLMQEFQASEGGMRELFNDLETVLDDQQLGRFHEMRQLMQDWRDHGRQMWQAVRELPDAVGMTEEQRQEYRAVLRDRWEEMQAEMRMRWEEGASMWERPDFEARRNEFFEVVGGLLGPEQLGLLAEYRQQLAVQASTEDDKEPKDVREIIRAMKRVRDLTSTQREALQEIEREAQRAFGQVRRDKEQLARLSKETKARIIKVLKPEQVKQFEQALEKPRSRLERREAKGERK
jgi:hypothetical protein